MDRFTEITSAIARSTEKRYTAIRDQHLAVAALSMQADIAKAHQAGKSAAQAKLASHHARWQAINNPEIVAYILELENRYK